MEGQGWFRRKVIGPFIDRDSPALIVSAIGGLLLLLVFPIGLKEKYLASYTGIPATALSLMGFVIAAAAIVVSVQDKGMIRHYKKQNPEVWEATKSVFFSTARLLGAIGVLVFVVGNSIFAVCQSSLLTLVANLYLTTITTALIFGIFQLNKMIYVLSKLMDAAQDTKKAAKIDREIEEEERRSKL